MINKTLCTRLLKLT